jgi:hypothetical protein
MPSRSFVLLCLVAFASLVVVAEGSGNRIESKKGKNKRGGKKSAGNAEISIASSSATHLPKPVNSAAPNNSEFGIATPSPSVQAPVDDLIIVSIQDSFNFIPPSLNSPYPSHWNINLLSNGANQELFENLLLNPIPQYLLNLLSSSSFSIPTSDRFALLPFIYFNQGRLDLFKLFLEKLNYRKYNPIILSGLIAECCNNRQYFLTILKTQHHVIFGSFRSFWDLMLQIDVYVENDSEADPNSTIVTLHRSVRWAFEYFATSIDEFRQPLTKHASLCIFNLLLDNPKNPFPESLLKEVLELPGIELNVAFRGSCVALFTLGLPQLPEYYPKLILSDPRLNVNCIVPATNRSHGHITCHVPPLPLFWHALIYLNWRALRILWNNKNLNVLPLIPSFFKLLRLALIFLFYHLWDGKAFRGERRLA